MKVKVKVGAKGFIYGKLRSEGEELDLIPVECTGDKGKTIKPEDQFSSEWMEKVAVKRGPKAKKEETEDEK